MKTNNFSPIIFGLDELNDRRVYEIIPTAWKAEFRSFDTSQLYGNEKALGKVIHEIGMPRDDVFITTKVMNSFFSEDMFLPSIEQSLERLNLEYVDLLLVH